MIKQMIQVQTTKSIIICMWYASNILPMMNLKNIQKCFYMYEYVVCIQRTYKRINAN